MDSASIGDAVHELFAEEKVVKGGDMGGALSLISMAEVCWKLLPNYTKT